MYDTNFITRAHQAFESAASLQVLCHVNFCMSTGATFAKLSDGCKSDYYGMMCSYYDQLVRKEGGRA